MKTINDYMREHSGGSSIDYNAMLDEINRLRKALEYYADPRKKQQDDDWGDWYDNGVLKLVTGRRARAALGKQK